MPITRARSRRRRGRWCRSRSSTSRRTGPPSQQPGGLTSPASVLSGSVAQSWSPAHAVTASEEDSWLLPSANSLVPAAHEWERRRRTSPLSGNARVRAAGDVRGEQVHHRRGGRRRPPGRPRQHAGGVEEVAVVEVVVVELLRPEGRRLPDHPLPVVVPEAERVALGAPVGLGPLVASSVSAAGPARRGVVGAHLAGDLEQLGGPVERLASEVGVRRGVRKRGDVRGHRSGQLGPLVRRQPDRSSSVVARLRERTASQRVARAQREACRRRSGRSRGRSRPPVTSTALVGQRAVRGGRPRRRVGQLGGRPRRSSTAYATGRRSAGRVQLGQLIGAAVLGHREEHRAATLREGDRVASERCRRGPTSPRAAVEVSAVQRRRSR